MNITLVVLVAHLVWREVLEETESQARNPPASWHREMRGKLGQTFGLSFQRRRALGKSDLISDYFDFVIRANRSNGIKIETLKNAFRNFSHELMIWALIISVVVRWGGHGVARGMSSLRSSLRLTSPYSFLPEILRRKIMLRPQQEAGAKCKIWRA